MGKHSGKIYVTKLAAAQRQLCAAIRMFFAGEDELAVHTVASAAYHVLSDLKAERGRDEAADNYLNSFFYAVRAYRQGTLPDYLAKDPKRMQWIRDMADRMPISASSEFKDVVASAPPEISQDFWRRRNAISNFLKHADRDAKGILDTALINNEDVIFRAIGASVHLNCELTSEKEFFVAFLWSTGKLRGKPIKGSYLQYFLKQLTLEEIYHLARRNLCYTRVDDDIVLETEGKVEAATEEYNHWLKKHPEL